MCQGNCCPVTCPAAGQTEELLLWRSMVGALLLGAMTHVTVDDSWQRHVAIVDAACLALTCAGNAGEIWVVV